MSESLRNDGRVWVPKKQGDMRKPEDIPEEERDYFLERKYPSFGNLVPRDIASRNAKQVCDEGRGVDGGHAVYLDFRDSINRLGEKVIRDRYGNLFDMYYHITADNPYKTPMKIYPAVHYTMGGLWVDYNLQSTIPGLFVLGEANFSDHGANRLGASALMQGLADGYFVAPYSVGNYLGGTKLDAVDVNAPEFAAAEQEINERVEKLLSVKGNKTPLQFHKELGKIMWNDCGMARNKEGLNHALKAIPELREEFWNNVKVVGDANEYNQQLERAGRVADFLEFAELFAKDALLREESCGGHFREEHQTEEGEAKRDDENFAHAAAYEWTGKNGEQTRHVEPLIFENVKLTQRSYK
jgi:succinate dehydrogenase / fumarate reductase flavoprotein subunit